MKKTIYTLFVCMAMFLPLCTQAQTSYLDSLRYIARNLYATLPPNSIVDGMLPEDSVLHTYFDGNLNNFMNQFQFQDAVNYFNLQRQSPVAFPDFDSILKITASYYNQGLIPLGMVDFSYYKIKTSSLEQNIIYEDSLAFALKILAGQENNWYQTESFTYFTSFYPVAETDTTWYILPSSLVFTNYNESTLLWLNAGDERGWFPVNFNSPFYVINSIPNHELKIKMSKEFPNGGNEPPNEIPVRNLRSSVLNKKGFFDEEILVSAMNMAGIDLCFDNYRNPAKPNEVNIGVAKVDILYNNRALGLRKPIIFIEGFDVDNNPLDDRFGDIDFNTLITGKSFNSEGKSVKENLKDLPDLIGKFRAKGFDIVFVDYQQGAGDMIANGNALIKIIQWVNKTKTGTEENVVMGASMGGLLARYALAKMEKNGCNHCTKLYATFDTPHQGANVPLGLQYGIQFIVAHTSSADAQGLYHLALGSKGAQQMLQKNIYPGADALRTNWNIILTELGHPQKCRKIAIANGNPAAQPYSFVGGDLILDVSKVKAGTMLAYIKVYAGPNCPNSNCNGLVMEGKLPKGAFKIFGKEVGKWSNSFFRLDYIYEAYYAGNQSHRPWDFAPGGGGEWLKQIADLPILDNFSTAFPKGTSFCFVPTINALDMTVTDMFTNVESLFSKIEERKFPQTFHPFDAIHINEFGENQQHVLIDIRKVAGKQNNVDFIMEQVDLVEKKVEDNLPASGGGTFNLATSPHPLFVQGLSGIIIDNGGKLHLNGNIKRNYGTSAPADNKNTEGLTMNYESANCYSNITINTNGIMMLGDNNYGSNGNNKAIATLGKGTQLLINSGGIMHIHSGSKLIIDEGATLIYKTGARIILDGDASDIEIKGKIMVESGATFTFEKGSSSVGGRLILNKTTDNGGRPIRNSGSTTTVNITGSQPSDQLVIVKGGTVELNFLGTLNLYNGIVLVDNNSRLLVTNNDLNIHNIVFSPLQANPTNAVGLDVKNERTTSVLLENNSFKNLHVGLVLQNDIYTPSVTIKNSTFYNCATGIVSNYKKFDFDNCLFSGCDKGISANTLYANSTMKDCRFNENDIGVELLPVSPIDIYMEGNGFTKNYTGISANANSKLTMQCNNFMANDYAINTLGLVNIGNKNLNGKTGNNNTFYENTNGITLYDGELYMDYGYNNFYNSLTCPPPCMPNYKFITGSILYGSNCLTIVSGFNNINANNNFWDPSPSFISSATQYYSLSTLVVGGSSVSVKLNGNLLSNLNTTCFTLEEGQTQTGGGNGVGKKDNGIIFDESLVIAPNPTNSKITVVYSTNSEAPAKISIYDYSGKEIQKLENQTFQKGNNVRYFDLSNLPKGLYIVVVNQNGEIKSQRLILQ